MVLGALLIIAFVPWALNRRNIHPLVELRLFADRKLTAAVIAMALFAMAFFGASLLFALYFQQVRGESPLSSGWLIAPQGFGAMLTMPLAGALADKIGPGKVVMTGLVLDTVGLGMLGFIDAQTPYAYLISAFVVMGLGMGATMMPMFSAAMSSLSNANIARGSTLLNITQQVAASCGTALFSVLLTNAFNRSDVIGPAIALRSAGDDPAAVQAVLAKFGLAQDQVPALMKAALSDMGHAYAGVFVVATVLVGLCLIPAFFLPRKPADHPLDPAAMVH
jgi:MFS family permease